MNKSIIVIGAGGHANVVLDVLLQQGGVDLIGLTDLHTKCDSVLGVPVLGTDDVLAEYDKDTLYLALGVGSVKADQSRQRIYERWVKQGYRFVGVRSPTATVSQFATVADSAQVMAGVIVQPGAHIGENALLNTGCQIDHGCHIAEHTHIAPGAILCADVKVKQGAHIGAGAVVVQGKTVGHNATVAAGAVVTSDVPDNVVVAGVPAKVVSI